MRATYTFQDDRGDYVARATADALRQYPGSEVRLVVCTSGTHAVIVVLEVVAS